MDIQAIFKDIQGIFRKQKPAIFLSEEEAIKLNKEIFNLLLGCETDIAELKKSISAEQTTLKAAKLADLENKFLNMRTKIDPIRSDMKNIIDLETQNKDFVLFNDDIYIMDKMARLDTLSAVLDELLELTNEKPVASELKGMVDFIYGKINILIDAVNNIISDDKHLEGTYSKLQYI
jgi:hypothetical protein